jgi:hypothetical protein
VDCGKSVDKVWRKLSGLVEMVWNLWGKKEGLQRFAKNLKSYSLLIDPLTSRVFRGYASSGGFVTPGTKTRIDCKAETTCTGISLCPLPLAIPSNCG